MAIVMRIGSMQSKSTRRKIQPTTTHLKVLSMRPQAAFIEACDIMFLALLLIERGKDIINLPIGMALDSPSSWHDCGCGMFRSFDSSTAEANSKMTLHFNLNKRR